MNENSTTSPIINDSSIIDVSGQNVVPLPRFDENEFESSNSNQYWKLGQKFSKKLSLNSNQVELLNKLNFADNVFNEIPFCRIQILKEFIRAYDFFVEKCKPVNKAYATVFDEMAEIIIYNKYNYRKESLNYVYAIDSIKSEIYNQILKFCENNIREVYAIKRKINTDLDYKHPDIERLYEKKILSKLPDFLLYDRSKVLDADSRTNLILNETNTNRWKIKFDDVTTHYSSLIGFTWEVDRLVAVNEKNPSVSHIFFEAAKFITDFDKIVALELYFKYLDKDIVSTKFENKQFPKLTQKQLFKNQNEVDNFVVLIKNFINDRNLTEALGNIPRIFEPKRKKISIDRSAIADIQKQDSLTVELLEEYLNDEEPIDIIETEQTLTEEFIIPEVETISEIKFKPELQLSNIQVSILEMFEKSSFSMLQNELEDYIKSKNLFLNSAIEAINDKCFEMLDDVLIEEDDDYYTIYPDYYKKLLLND
ncbi:tellurite resistance TerB C-terminal domain-containing protein [Soonwooa sp.]|uniref:tellurite resistance TerB C-terminal domain-containing protein n=1 Tax=Soonwooa sp. TaxID=1938592 RepID=UPI0026355DFE|nr:tellurite resistance TerB C-terminal domain-containing protein [Soonwooa sp.]